MEKSKSCRYCRAKDLTLVEVISRHGSRTQTSFLCPRCGETLGIKWSKKAGERNA